MRFSANYILHPESGSAPKGSIGRVSLLGILGSIEKHLKGDPS